jgi:hypothetical protein
LIRHKGVYVVIPAQAVIQGLQRIAFWVTACAGMTRVLNENFPTLELILKGTMRDA